MKFISLLFMLVMSLPLWANQVKIEINPTKPVAGEVFQAYFRIFTDIDEEPAISFSPSNIEVVGKSNQGISTSTIYANGKLTITREMNMVYDLVAAKPGIANLRDISIQVGNKTIRHPTIMLTVLKEPEALADVFVMTDITKKSLYIGEGIIARYYLYSKVPVSNLDIKKYPKLNGFLKRFLQEPEKTERVSVDGQLYMRTQIYAAKLFPEKAGDLKIDPLQLSATYPNSRSGDPFGALGMNRDFKTKTISSETIKVEVRPLPEPIPPHFTGLVGSHEFQLQFGQTKLIVNEPLGIKLTVSGDGALENMEAPELIKNSALEEFESNGDLKISDAEHATKIFDYTYLAKENFTFPARVLTLSYFEPKSQKYISTQLNIPEIIVAGGRPDQTKQPISKVAPDAFVQMPKVTNQVSDLVAPLSVEEWQWKSWLPVLNLTLAFLALILSLGWIIKTKKIGGVKFNGEVPASFKKGEFKRNEFVHWMTPLIKESGKSPLVILKESPLPEDSKRYFIDLLNANDNEEYSARKWQMEYKYESSHFKELGRYIESSK